VIASDCLLFVRSRRTYNLPEPVIAASRAVIERRAKGATHAIIAARRITKTINGSHSMSIVQNAAKRRLAAGDLSLGMGLRQSRTVDIATIARTLDFDWLFIDMEHNSMDVDAAAQIAMAALAAGVAPIVRVPGKEHFHATRLLDAGAQGIVVPHVDTVAEAQDVVSFCKYPPIGHRSVAGAQPQLGFRSMPIGEAMRVVNDEMLVVVMLETPQAIANAEAIAAVPGVDVLLIGFNDLCAEMGVPGEFGGDRAEAACAAVVAACRKHGKHPGIGGVYDHGLMQKFIGMGARFILSGSDLAFIMAGGRERTGFLRGIKL
jgi:2-keto-3-deoxy-L-rhamnonate aldolase RhmA